MVNSYPIALFLMVKFHSISPFYGELSPHPRWLSLPGLTLLLTASDMDPACEASFLADVVGLVTLSELRQCNLDERCHGMVWVSIQ